MSFQYVRGITLSCRLDGVICLSEEVATKASSYEDGEKR